MATRPPIKTQGTKIKLLPFIQKHIEWSGKGRWIEPFVGSGAVLFNIGPKRALAGDANRHLIRFYKAIQDGAITPESVRKHLEREGGKLSDMGEAYYYEVRDRFNESGNLMDLLFLNRSCFNGIMRFNPRGEFNVPFCKIATRFTPRYVSMVVDRISWVRDTMETKKWEFVDSDWRETVKSAGKNDFMYLDPPYSGTFSTYYDVWDDEDMDDLVKFLHNTRCRFALSLWYEKMSKRNGHVSKFKGFTAHKYTHRYHVGGVLARRNHVTEALITNF